MEETRCQATTVQPMTKAADDFVSYADLVELTGDSRELLRYHLWAGNMPDPDKRFGRSPAWRWSTIRSWVEARQRYKDTHWQ